MSVNSTIKRIIALTEIFAILLLVCVVAFAGSATYNSGKRHVESDSLSSAAESYYAGYDYDLLSEQSSSELLATLRSLMTTTHSYKSTYADCRDLSVKTDSNGTEGVISLIYTSVEVTRSQFGGNAGTWNREHVWPKSLGGFTDTGAGSDLHHIRPSDATVNARRDNNKYGNVENGSEVKGSALVGGMVSGYLKGGYFEPLDNAKGDVARICLYVYVRYGGEISKCSNITNVFESVDVLLEWCEMDPVDEWEMSRNDVVEGIQGNRNVFIDYPEYAWLLFGKEVPDTMVTPSGEAMSSGESGAPGAGVTPEIPEEPGEFADPETCEHEFAHWQYTEDGQRRRACILCGWMEYEPYEDNSSSNTVITAVAISVAVVVVLGVGIYVYRRHKK